MSANIPNLFDDDDDIKNVAINYLFNKYKGSADCDTSSSCRFSCDRKEIETLLSQVLPPVTKDELEIEIDRTIKSFKDPSDVTELEFMQVALKNSYWATAGALVVKELIYLDCLSSFYTDGSKMLSDDDYDVLKESLTWEGSAVATMRGKEAKFISAVASSRRGAPLMSNDDYDNLKAELKSENSWVVNRMQDPLEKLGVDTFLGYLHREMIVSTGSYKF